MLNKLFELFGLSHLKKETGLIESDVKLLEQAVKLLKNVQVAIKELNKAQLGDGKGMLRDALTFAAGAQRKVSETKKVSNSKKDEISETIIVGVIGNLNEKNLSAAYAQVSVAGARINSLIKPD